MADKSKTKKKHLLLQIKKYLRKEIAFMDIVNTPYYDFHH